MRLLGKLRFFYTALKLSSQRPDYFILEVLSYPRVFWRLQYLAESSFCLSRAAIARRAWDVEKGTIFLSVLQERSQ